MERPGVPARRDERGRALAIRPLKGTSERFHTGAPARDLLGHLAPGQKSTRHESSSLWKHEVDPEI